MLTVKDLRYALEDLPDELPVYLCIYRGDGSEEHALTYYASIYRRDCRHQGRLLLTSEKDGRDE